jgi:hypothetical protein
MFCEKAELCCTVLTKSAKRKLSKDHSEFGGLQTGVLDQNRTFTLDNLASNCAKENSMSLLLIIVVLLLVFGGGGWYAGNGPYRTGSWGLGGVLVFILIIYLLIGNSLRF